MGDQVTYRGDTVRVAVKRNRLDRLWRLLANRWFGSDFSEEKVVRGRLLDPPSPRRRSCSSGGGSNGGRSGGVPDIEDVGIIRW